MPNCQLRRKQTNLVTEKKVEVEIVERRSREVEGSELKGWRGETRSPNTKHII